MTDYVKDFGNGYKIQKVFANEVNGYYGDIYDFRADVLKEHPGAKILEGYVVIDHGLGLVPNGCNDWNSTLTEAMLDYSVNVFQEVLEPIHFTAFVPVDHGKSFADVTFTVQSGWLQDYFDVDNRTQLDALLENSNNLEPAEIYMSATQDENISGLDILSISHEKEPVGSDYIKEINSALEALNRAIESIDVATNSGIKIHPSIVNSMISAKLIVEKQVEELGIEQERSFEPEPEKDFVPQQVSVPTPMGDITVTAKLDSDYPGVYIDLKGNNVNDTFESNTVMLATVEYDPNKETVQTLVYADAEREEPSHIVEHENVMQAQVQEKSSLEEKIVSASGRLDAAASKNHKTISQPEH